MRSTIRAAAVALCLTPCLTACLTAATAEAQTAPTPPRRAEQAHAWLQLFHEQRLTPRWSLLGEAQFRRADVPGTTPQQLLLRTAVQRTLTTGATAGFGYAYVATSVYGETPGAAPFDEHRVWQQLQLSHRTGPVAWAHRFRSEQRWLEQPTAGGSWRFRQRVRPFTRATVDVASLGVPIPRTYVTSWAEVFLTVGASPNGQVFDQSRLALQAGYRFSPRLRAEAGYMQQYIQRGGSRETENNHTLVLGFHAVGG